MGVKLRNRFRTAQIGRDTARVFTPVPVVVRRSSPNIGNTTWKCAACRKDKHSHCFSLSCNCVCPDLVAEGFDV